jgi:hypothetical protein
MDLRPGALLGLPPGVPSVVFDVAYWRDLLVLLALAIGGTVARRRHGWALALAIAWAVLALRHGPALRRPAGSHGHPLGGGGERGRARRGR